MKKYFYLLNILLLPFLGFGQSFEIFEKNIIVNPGEILKFSEGASAPNAEILTNKTADTEIFRTITEANFKTLSLDLPIKGTDYTLELYASKVFSDNFILKTSTKGVVDLPKIRTYHGSVKGHESKVVAITISENGIEGLIDIDGELFTLSTVQNTDLHVIYSEREATFIPPSFENDQVIWESDKKNNEEVPANTSGVGCKILQVYIEVDHTLYTAWGGNNTAVASSLATVFNSAKGYYQNENIEIELSNSLFWTTTDPYVTNSTIDALNLFKTHWNNLNNTFQGNVAHLFTNKYGGGVAFLDVLQGSLYRQVAYGVDGYMQNIGSNFNNYAWNVEVFSHELGHNIGSPHTQSCTWPGGPIDNCVGVEDGSCSTGPPPVNGGTIMSYCQFIGTSYATMLNNGFGPLPGDLIRSKIQSSGILQATVPPAPTYSGITNICAFTSTGLSGLGCSNGTIKWYDVATGGTAFHTGSTYLTPFLSSSRSYYIECQTPDCVSPRTQISISVTNIIGPPSSNSTKCGSGSKTIVTSGCSGGVLNWYNSASGNTPIATGNNFVATGLQVGNTYTYWSKCVLNSCSGVYTPHTITVSDIPEPPIVNSVTVCLGSPVTLTATGCAGTVYWYNSPIKDQSSLVEIGSSYTVPTFNYGFILYFVHCKTAGCISDNTVVTVTGTSVSAPVIAATPINITQGGSATLAASSCTGTINWYTSTATSSNVATGTSFTTPILNAPTTYYVRCVANGCLSAAVPYPVTVNGCIPIRILGIAENVSSGITAYEVSNHIKATSILTGGSVKYDAANFIELLPGFSANANAGGTFKAIIDGCGGL